MESKVSVAIYYWPVLYNENNQHECTTAIMLISNYFLWSFLLYLEVRLQVSKHTGDDAIEDEIEG